MFKIRFFIAVAIYLAVTIMLPFFVPIPVKMYLMMMGIFTVGYLVPSVLSVREKLSTAFLIWLVGAVISLLMYDYAKTTFDDKYVFLQNWQKLYSTGLLILMGLQFYARFTAELILKQLTKK